MNSSNQNPFDTGGDSDNPYAAHPQLTPLEADVLWEYAKLSKVLKTLCGMTRTLSETPSEALLNQLRGLERQMGLVLTLFKASLWAVVVDGQEEIEQAEAEEDRGDFRDGDRDASLSQTGETTIRLQHPQQRYQPHRYDDDSIYEEESTM
ncbi:hypothetical protein BOTBODRAFT_33950 [Botryobasidium botryosum FD-172 SS1]|uniref:DASH complex subunit DAD3 n=1 Tax=Botryobasidium botryosum (strain FD-172 SS1) TaxID=930990 RepID=A0A067MBC7_BOTB1|nr:hypothetical protein BOTBODRAFT_33950 [Botryobasidium botryosum FD-172 SS1]